LSNGAEHNNLDEGNGTLNFNDFRDEDDATQQNNNLRDNKYLLDS
jgi:hypothetical protein